MDPSLLIRVTGPVAIIATNGLLHNVRGKQAQELLAMVTLSGGNVSAETAAQGFWGDNRSTHWRGALRGVVSKVRNVLAEAGAQPDDLSLSQGMIRLNSNFTDNVSRTEHLITQATTHAINTEQFAELRQLTLELRFPFLAWSESAFADLHRHRIEALLDRAEHVVLDHYRTVGSHSDAIQWAENVLTRDPVDTMTRTTLIELHAELGNVAAARAEYVELERVLATEYGLKPSQELRAKFAPAPRDHGDSDRLTPRVRHPHAASPFIGRVEELAVISRAWEHVRSSASPRFVLVRGPAGIGKTRTVDVATKALQPDRELWGHSRIGVETAWGPFADALGDLFAKDAQLAHALALAHPALPLLVPEAVPVNDVRHDELSRGGDLRHEVIETAKAVAREIVRRPTVLVLDDMQWTRPDGIAVIDTLIHEIDGPVLVLGTCREISKPLAQLTERASRHGKLDIVDLAPFGVTELTELLHDTVEHAHTLTDEQVAAFQHRTGGLPLFVTSVIRDAPESIADGSSLQIPESVSLWLENYLRTLSTEQRRILEVVATQGSRGELTAVEAVARANPLDVADLLDGLAVAGLVTIDDDGRIRIPHDLTQRVVWQSIPSARRSTLHRLTGDYLASVGAPAYFLAVHWSLAGAARQRQAAAAHLEAGMEALQRGAWNNANEHFDQARSRAQEPDVQVRALIGAGRAQLELRDHRQARTVLESAIELANFHALDHQMAEATLLLVGRAGRGAILDDDGAQLTHLETARTRLQQHLATRKDSELEVLLGRIEIELATAMLFVSTAQQRDELLTHALDRIRSSSAATPNDVAIALLEQRMGRIDPTSPHQRLVQLDEVLTLPRGKLDVGLLAATHLYRHEDLLRAGNRKDATASLEEANRVANRSGQTYWLWAIHTWQALQLLFAGRLEEADDAFARAAARRPQVTEAYACYQVNLVGLRLLQGRIHEMLDVLRFAVEMYPQIPTWRAALALALVESDTGDDSARRGAAAELLSEFVAEKFANLPEDTNRFFALGILAHVAAAVGSKPAANLLWPLLEPYRGQLVLLNCYGGAGACWGPVEWALARIAPLTRKSRDVTTELWLQAIAQTEAVMPVLAERIRSDASFFCEI